MSSKGNLSQFWNDFTIIAAAWPQQTDGCNQNCYSLYLLLTYYMYDQKGGK